MLIFNEEEIYKLARKPCGPVPVLTPVEQHGGYPVKRDDFFTVAGVRGGKARTCWHLAQGAKGLVTAGHFGSPQIEIVGSIARQLGIPCRAYIPSDVNPTGKPINIGNYVQKITALGVTVVKAENFAAGRNNVIVSRAHKNAVALGWQEIPFGMECDEAVQQTRQQVANLPHCERLVIPVGSGMSLAGVLWGLRDCGKRITVAAITVGADPAKRLDRYAPPDWRDNVTLTPAVEKYSTPAAFTTLDDIELDPHYEAKCLPFLKAGDLLWVVGIRKHLDS